MTDYRCPSCDGGFPDHALDDGCPWCGEAMDGERPSGVELTAPISTAGVDRFGVNTPPTRSVGEPLYESDETTQILSETSRGTLKREVPDYSGRITVGGDE